MKTMLPAIVLLGSLAASSAHAEEPAQPFVGYRNDATGVFPPDCKPVTEWNEWDLKTVERKHRGRMRKFQVGDKRNPKNIVWKTPVDLYCNGGIVVVGGKVLVQADRGGSAFARDLVPEFLGNQLVCLDAETGKILWKTDLHHLGKLPPEKAKQVEQDLRETNAFYPEAYTAFLKYRRIAGPLLGGGHGQPNYAEEMPEDYEKTYADAAKAFEEFWPQVPKSIKALKELSGQKNRLNRMLTWNYSQLAFGNFLKRYHKERLEKRNDLAKYGYDWCAWYGMNSFVGAAMQTPVSDGEHVYVHTAYNDVFCVDLDGNIKWTQWFGPMGEHHGTCLGSPVLVGDVLIINGSADKSLPKGKYVRGLNKKTGEVLWTLKDFWTGKSYTRITPVPLALPVEGTDETMEVIWTGPGNVIRVSDGKVLATKIGCHGNGRHVGVSRKRKIIVLDNGSADGGAGSPALKPAGTMAVKLTAPNRDEVAAEVLWHEPKGPSRLVVRDEIVYGFGGRKGSVFQARDLTSGEVLGTAKLPRRERPPTHYSAIAGDHLFGLRADGSCLLFRLGEKPEFVRINRLGDNDYTYRYFNQGSQPFFSGNRLFIQSYNAVYCLGDPERPPKLSKPHK